jgi:hypothetical protein
MLWVGFEHTIPASEQAKALYALDRSATVTGNSVVKYIKIEQINKWNDGLFKWKNFIKEPSSLQLWTLSICEKFYCENTHVFKCSTYVQNNSDLLVGNATRILVTLRVVGGDEKGSLETETAKYGHESYETGTRKWLRWRGPAAIVNDRPVLSSERAPQFNKHANVRQ